MYQGHINLLVEGKCFLSLATLDIQVPSAPQSITSRTPNSCFPIITSTPYSAAVADASLPSPFPFSIFHRPYIPEQF